MGTSRPAPFYAVIYVEATVVIKKAARGAARRRATEEGLRRGDGPAKEEVTLARAIASTRRSRPSFIVGGATRATVRYVIIKATTMLLRMRSPGRVTRRGAGPRRGGGVTPEDLKRGYSTRAGHGRASKGRGRAARARLLKVRGTGRPLAGH